VYGGEVKNRGLLGIAAFLDDKTKLTINLLVS
jgi:hypothetical protein